MWLVEKSAYPLIIFSKVNDMRNRPSTPLHARFTKKAGGCEVCVDAIVQVSRYAAVKFTQALALNN